MRRFDDSRSGAKGDGRPMTDENGRWAMSDLFSDRGGGERLFDEHDRDVRHDRVDQARGGTEQSLLDHRRLVAEMLAVLLRQHAADIRRQVDQLQISFRLGADENLQQLRIDRHWTPLSRAEHNTAGSGVRGGIRYPPCPSGPSGPSATLAVLGASRPLPRFRW